MKVGSLFSGIGGLDLGLERAGMRVVWQSEIDPYACRVLAKHWPDVPNHGDITQIDWQAVEPVDVLCGGFPCQDISSAGRRAGINEGTRSGLWFEYLESIRVLRPRFVVIENVSALLIRGLDIVCGSLSSIGYDAEWQMLSACRFMAPHPRERVFVVAYPGGEPGIRPRIFSGDSHAQANNWQKAERGEYRQFTEMGTETARGIQAAREHWTSEPGMGRMAHGVPDGMDRLRGLGNAVVPQVAEYVGRCIMDAAKRAGQ